MAGWYTSEWNLRGVGQGRGTVSVRGYPADWKPEEILYLQ